MPYLKTPQIIMTDSECLVRSQGVTRCSLAVGNRDYRSSVIFDAP